LLSACPLLGTNKRVMPGSLSNVDGKGERKEVGGKKKKKRKSMAMVRISRPPTSHRKGEKKKGRRPPFKNR